MSSSESHRLIATGEVAREPIVDSERGTVTFTESHTISDVLRWLISEGDEPEAMIDEIRLILFD